MLGSAAVTVALGISLLAAGGQAAAAGIPAVGLGTAAHFAILAGTPDITNTESSVVTGDVGIHPASAVNGFPPGTINGTIHAADAVALQGKSDLTIAYNDAAGRSGSVVGGGTLGTKTLVAGVYNAGGVTLDLTGTLTLDGQNDPASVWIFQATSDLVTASSSTVRFINGGQACNVFWQVTSSATLGSGSTFAGTILALTSITMNSGVRMEGRALARNGTVTLINDTITTPVCAAPAPTPTPTPTASASASGSASAAASGLASGSASAAASGSPSGSAAATATASRTASPTASRSAGPVIGPTATPSRSARPTVPVAPELTLPPTDAADIGSGAGSSSAYAGVLVALGVLLVLASVMIARRRPQRR